MSDGILIGLIDNDDNHKQVRERMLADIAELQLRVMMGDVHGLVMITISGEGEVHSAVSGCNGVARSIPSAIRQIADKFKA